MNLRKPFASVILIAAVAAPALAASEGPALYTVMKGTFRNAAGGTCAQPFYKSGDVKKTVRGEEGMAATVVNNGVTVSGDLVLRGARVGQMVNTVDDKVIFLFEDNADGGLHFISMGPPALTWGEFKLERCP